MPEKTQKETKHLIPGRGGTNKSSSLPSINWDLSKDVDMRQKSGIW